MKLKNLIKPSVTPVTINECKAYLNIDADMCEHDALIAALIETATEFLDGITGRLQRCLISQQWRIEIERFYSVICLPLPPFISLTSFEYLNTSDVWTTVNGSVYEVVTSIIDPAEIRLKSGQSFPTDINTDVAHPVRIDFECGYGSNWNDVPERLRHAIKIIVADLFKHRGGSTNETVNNVSFTVENMIRPYINYE